MNKYIQALKYYENILQVEPDSIGVIIDYGVGKVMNINGNVIDICRFEDIKSVR